MLLLAAFTANELFWRLPKHCSCFVVAVVILTWVDLELRKVTVTRQFAGGA